MTLAMDALARTHPEQAGAHRLLPCRLVSLIDRFMEQLDQVFRLRFLHVHTRC